MLLAPRWKLYVPDIQHIGKKRRRKKQREAISPGHLHDPELVCPGVVGDILKALGPFVLHPTAGPCASSFYVTCKVQRRTRYIFCLCETLVTRLYAFFEINCVFALFLY